MPGLLATLAIIALLAWMFVRIAAKAGLNPLWAITMVVPVVNIVMLFLFAFTRWPAVPEAQAS